MTNDHESEQASVSIPTRGLPGSEICERYVPRPGRGDAEWIARERQREREKNARQMQAVLANIGRRYASATFDSFETPTPKHAAAKSAVVAFAGRVEEHTEAGEGLVLFGPPGTGKDHLMVAALRAACQCGISVEWINGLDFYGTMRDRIGDDRDEGSAIAALCRPSILAISDPLPPVLAGKSAGTLSDYQAQTMFRIIDRRYRELRPTWCTFNVEGGEELAARISEPIRDRLRDGAVQVPCFWESYRRSHA